MLLFAERQFENSRVGGSNPSRATTFSRWWRFSQKWGPTPIFDEEPKRHHAGDRSDPAIRCYCPHFQENPANSQQELRDFDLGSPFRSSGSLFNGFTMNWLTGCVFRWHEKCLQRLFIVFVLPLISKPWCEVLRYRAVYPR